MLIIFDLDDTLIDTTGALTPYKLKEFLQPLCRRGGLDFSEAYQELSRLNAYHQSSKQATSLFLSKYSFNTSLVQEALSKLFSPFPEDFVVPTTPFAKEILHFFRDRHALALVSVGNKALQLSKLEKAGIDSSIFSMIAIPEEANKKPSYEVLLKNFSISPDEVWVCGDKVEIDLRPANELGFHTIHMRWGRGLKAKKEAWVEYSITSLKDLRGIIP